MAHLASQVLQWTVNLAGKSSLHSAETASQNITAQRAQSFPTTVCPRQLALTVSETGAFTMQCIQCQCCSTILTLTHEQGGPLCLLALTVNWLGFTLENYRTQCKALVKPLCLDRVCMWRRSVTVIVCFVWIFSCASSDKYNKDYEVCP